MQLLNDFKQHLIASGKPEHTASLYTQRVAGFVKYVSEQRIEKITEELGRSYKRTKHGNAMVAVRQFVKFAAQLPLPLNAEEDKAPLRSAQSQREIAPSQQWLLEKLIDEKTYADDLVGKLGRQVMDHYLYFQGRIKGEENLEHVYRLADEAKKLIESNLELFFASLVARTAHFTVRSLGSLSRRNPAKLESRRIESGPCCSCATILVDGQPVKLYSLDGRCGFSKAGDFKQFRQRKANEKAICQRVFFAASDWPQASPDVDYW